MGAKRLKNVFGTFQSTFEGRKIFSSKKRFHDAVNVGNSILSYSLKINAIS